MAFQQSVSDVYHGDTVARETVEGSWEKGYPSPIVLSSRFRPFFVHAWCRPMPGGIPVCELVAEKQDAGTAVWIEYSQESLQHLSAIPALERVAGTAYKRGLIVCGVT